MLEAMRSARLGNDGFGEDPTVNELQDLAARKVGKESALFVPSGTQGNLTALMCHTQRGDEFIAEARSHIITVERGYSAVAGLIVRPIEGHMGAMSPGEVENSIINSKKNPNRALATSLICLENTHNLAGGTVIPPNNIRDIRDVARRYGIPVHLDGARIFNAAVALGADVRDLVRDVDSVMYCLSKGLCAPVGSLLAGEEAFIEKAREVRKTLGGGMRQAGVLAAAGIIALEKMVNRLGVDHENARVLARGLASIEGIKINRDSVQTNIVHFGIEGTGLDAQTFIETLNDYNIRFFPRGEFLIRAVTHKDVTREDVQYVLGVIERVIQSKARTA